MKINFYSSTSGIPVVVITIELINNKLKVLTSKNFKVAAREILNNPALPKDGTPVKASDDPQAFLEALPNTYLGSYFWAEVAK